MKETEERRNIFDNSYFISGVYKTRLKNDVCEKLIVSFNFPYKKVQ